MLGRGVTFGAIAIGGAALGARMSQLVPEPVLLAAFAALLVIVAAVMAMRLVRMHRVSGPPGERTRVGVDDPIITFRPSFACQCPRALMVLVAATVVGLLTGFLGVGGGFLVVPALVLALGLPMKHAAGTSLVVIAITSAAALSVRAGVGSSPDWTLVGLLTLSAVAGGYLGAQAASRVCTDRLAAAFTVLLLLVAAYAGVQATSALI